MTINEMRLDIAKRNKKGISFILASIILWMGIFVIWLLPIKDILTRNLFTFFCTAPLVPLAFLISRIIKAEFSAKDNPLNNLGILFSINQFLYILIAMWAYAAAPSKMVMILAIIFGAHLLPFSWLYRSKAYMVMSIIIPIVILGVGSSLKSEHTFILPGIMTIFEIVFAIWLTLENRKEI
ncbi:MAG TPA: hypothetical protein VIO64_11635 [Pseudobacteroides sp.]|uniref:DUF7010 family protein n=1 Tax=Pseudobacteroides sp. TaxID=1968840 RepID=UPI002F92EF8A